jgi:phage terminase small subunit
MSGVKGKSGRKSKPTALHRLEGTFRPDRANPREPKPRLGRLVPPRWLIGEGLREWKRIAPDLEATGVAAPIDRSLLAVYCALWGRFVAGEQTGAPMRSTYIVQMRGLAATFGIGPGDRHRVEGPQIHDDGSEQSEFERFAARRRARLWE